ncbi:MAG: hypothetical protein SRB1_01185 [Desulfobacteraceae bacterium Eth-SRB1]|nr:MAG: hypothetical protein SRB1_01185 [Desulfobacteraceae bacterium Eth-SRB1]
MAWPKKGTRKLVIHGEEYLWHYDAHCPFCSNDVFTIGQAEKRFVLYIDPFPWEFEMRPATVVKAVTWALSNGWSCEAGPTRAMAWNQEAQDFAWLPDDERHLL